MGNSCTGKSNQSEEDISNPETCLQVIKREEVAQHSTPEDCWIIIDQIVYDVSSYWQVHPGGGDYIKRWAGKDATLAYREFNHSRFADIQLKTLGAEVGRIDDKIENFNEKLYLETPLPKKTADIETFAEKGDMMCYQCQQTVNGAGCTDMGVCGKSPTIAALQDLIVHYLKGLSQYLTLVDQKHWDNKVYHLFLHCFFMTLTNVNFNLDKHFKYIKDLAEARDKYKQIYEQEVAEDKRDTFLQDANSPSKFVYKNEQQYLFQEARKVGIVARKKLLNPDLFGLIEMCVYGLKGAAAYMYHAEGIRNETEGVYDEEQRAEVFKQLFTITAGLTKQEPTLEYLLGLNMDLGKANFAVMDMLDIGHNKAFGKPDPSPVNRAPVEGKCILVSGHDMMVLKKLLKQTEGKGVNIYTHGEMLPAHGYPELKKYPHMVGNFGTAWFNQTNEFPDFPGAVLLNSNCLIQPQPSYAKRIFTTHIVGWDEVKHIEGDDYSELIDCALKQPGFKQKTRQFKKYQHVESEMTGYGHASMVELLVPEIQAGNLKQIYLVGGCDNLDPSRQKYLELMLELPQDAIVLTLGCAKFRLFGYKEKMGYLPGGNKVPRLIDVGQCNDAYSAIKIALALTKLLGVGVNDLPLHLVLSWVEQKAVIILLTLLHLGIQNINLGPNLPGFLTPNLVNFLVENYKLSPMSLPKQTEKLIKYNRQPEEGRAMEMFQKIQPFDLCSLSKKQEIATNIYQFKFDFLNKNSSCNLQPGQHVVFRVQNSKGEYFSRAYTPITKQGSKGSFDIIVKIYPEGLMSNFMKNMDIGDYLEVQGPCGSTIYKDNRDSVYVKCDDVAYDQIKNINMVCGGTSVVSMFQIVQDIVEKNQENVKVNMIVANSKVAMKVMEKDFEELKKNSSQKVQENIKFKFITSEKDGRISEDKFKEFLLQSNEQNFVNMVAGPISFRNSAEQIFEGMGYDMNKIIRFY